METLFRVEEQGYEYKPKKWQWLTDILWKILNKLGAIRQHLGSVPYYEFRKHEDNPDFLEYIHKAIRVEEYYHRRGEYAVVMGIENYMLLKRQMNQSSPWGYPPTDFQITAGPFGYRDKIFNIPIHVVTSLSGIAMIPKVIIEVEQVRKTNRGSKPDWSGTDEVLRQFDVADFGEPELMPIPKGKFLSEG